MKRVPEPDLPLPRASLPEGCSDLIDAYELREASQEEKRRYLLTIAAMLHDAFVERLEPEALCAGNEELLKQRISDFLHPILLAHPDLEKRIGSSSNLVEMLFHVVVANADEGES